MLGNLYRNETLVQMETYETEPAKVEELVSQVRSKWALLREKGHAGDYPVEVLRSARNGGSVVKVVEVFRWRSVQDKVNASTDADYRALTDRISALTVNKTIEEYTQAVRGFNTNFPGIGGVELLKGVCSCLLTVDGIVENYQMSVKNGVVLMHRSPQMDLDGDGKNEMYLKILMHGGEIIQAGLGPIRVEQNFNVPNDGIVKSNGGENDFPGTAIWRVGWRIKTAMGPVLTDPDTPLIFGPAKVEHYPPVGTHFHSPTGPVALIHEETGNRVGTLTPGELTAFDIVVTKDDEIYADVLNTPPSDIFEILEEWNQRTRGGEDVEPVLASD
ncbi:MULTISPECIES: hypothetical protein [Actinomadura]|uniref:Uncharacterized protein n=1 Tax=Actinomadura yumaensis TaxID=111807 RepID=A0ABW2CYZ4_9ACTN|nr:hypothetical protein [Actinomadura sp. J1-007]